MRKLSKTEWEYRQYGESEDECAVVNLEFSKEGLLVGNSSEADLIPWDDIATARADLALVSFNDEQYKQWQCEQWIPVTVEMPPPNTTVLVYYDGYMEVAGTIDSPIDGKQEWVLSFREAPTHWQSLPASPASKEESR